MNKKGDLKKIFLTTILLMVLGVGMLFVYGTYEVSTFKALNTFEAIDFHAIVKMNTSYTFNVTVFNETDNMTINDSAAGGGAGPTRINLTNVTGEIWAVTTTPFALGCNGTSNGTACQLNITGWNISGNNASTELILYLDDTVPEIAGMITNATGSDGTSNLANIADEVNLSANISDYAIHYVLANVTSTNASVTAGAGSNISVLGNVTQYGCTNTTSSEYNCTIGFAAYDNASNLKSATINLTYGRIL